MKIGIPQGLLFRRYEPTIRHFVNELQLDAVYSGPTTRDILEQGIRTCVDEACLPIKIFHGHVAKLRGECDKIAVPRLMKCEFGESICPKFAGLPELVKSGSGKDDLIFTSPLFLNDPKRLMKTLIRDGEAIGLKASQMKNAIKGFQTASPKGTGNLLLLPLREGTRVGLLGHPYNTGDPFANRNLIHKLRGLGLDVITGEEITILDPNLAFSGLLKQPYWLFFRESYSKAMWLSEHRLVDGIVYVSSFNCGTDSVTIEMIRNGRKEMPLLVIKLDEHTGEAGLDTRIEAFADLLERRKKHAGDLPEDRGHPHLWKAAIPGAGSRLRDPGTQQHQGSGTGFQSVPLGHLPPIQTDGR